MIADNQTNTVYFSDLLRSDPRFTKTCKEITTILDSYNIPCRFLENSNDIWARDYMPIQVSKDKFIEYRYDPDYLQGLKPDERDSKTYTDLVCESLHIKTIKSNIILDGGNVIKSSNCVILTDKIFKENEKHYDRSQLLDKLKELFETDKIVIIPWDKSEPYGHADGMIRFIDDNTVLVNGYFRQISRRFEKQFFGALGDNSIEYKELNYDVPNPNEDLNWAYINFLQTKDLIIVPKLGIDEDQQAFELIMNYYPEYSDQNRIFQVDMSEIVKHGGALNCITWTINEALCLS
jgi:agmatine/peptidylarginine deiminase